MATKTAEMPHNANRHYDMLLTQGERFPGENQKKKKERFIMKRTKRNNKGFSLVELIIVIAIMAILAGVLAIALFKFLYL